MMAWEEEREDLKVLLVDSWRPKFGGKLRGNCGCINEDSSDQKLRKLWLHNGEFL